ncbi:amidohydrolase family protein [Pseudonocardia sp. EC080610-09]|uniref:amidohydrolase family protein n=1 Tax=Pseudonocardia sp. EC080610-09 TaxID=1688404 RepID=UPI000761CE25
MTAATPDRTAPRRIDVHAHYMPHGRLVDGPGFPVLSGDDRGGQITIDDRPFRRVRPSLWDVGRRIADLDEAGVAIQVISPVPVTLGLDGGYLRAQNDALATAAAASGDRLLAFGAVPFTDPDAAAGEVTRLATLPGVVGVQVATMPNGLELDAPELGPFLTAAEENDLPLFVHPTEQARMVRGRGARTSSPSGCTPTLPPRRRPWSWAGCWSATRGCGWRWPTAAARCPGPTPGSAMP